MSTRHQQTIARQRTRSNRQGNRRRQRQGTGAGHHQHRHGNPQCLGRLHQIPAERRTGRHQQQNRNKIRGNAVSQLDDARLLHRRAFHQSDDGRQARRLAHLLDAHHQRTLGIDRAAGHGISGLLRHGAAFARQQRLIGRAAAFDHHPIHRNDFTGTHQNVIAHRQIRHQHLFRFTRLRELRQFLRKGGQQFGQRLGHAQGFLACRHF